jgi:nucleoid DNA-binding protein
MNKAEIIRKLAKKVGVQDLDAKIFFEVFLRKISQQLNLGETIKINNLGYFQVSSSNIQKRKLNNSVSAHADVIVFHPLQYEKLGTNESLIFNIPYKNDEEFNLIDSYFSLSFGKSVIPLEGANISEYFIPPTGNELRRLFDSKADKLLKDVEVIENFISGDAIIVDPDLKNPNLERQIREESLLDMENEENRFVQDNEFKELTWDFGERLDSIDLSDQSVEENGLNEVQEVENDLIEKNIPLQKEEIKLPDEFQRVNSIASDINIDNKNITDPQSENNAALSQVSNENSDLLKSINEELNEKGNSAPPILPVEIKTKPLIGSNRKKPEIDNKVLLRTSREIKQRTGGNPAYTKRKGVGLLLILFSITVLCGAVYLYLKYININNFESKQVVTTSVTQNNIPPVIIERDYDIPVTYPYTKDSNVSPAVDPVDKSVFNQNDSKKIGDSRETQQKIQNIPNEQVKQAPENNKLTPVSAVVKNKDFIFQSGEKYIVQVSSWSTERAAIKHADYFKNKGYQTEVLKTRLDRGTWYRVRIGYFNSENEAVAFYNKNR